MKIQKGDIVITTDGNHAGHYGIVLDRISWRPAKFLVRFPRAQPPWEDICIVSKKHCTKYDPSVTVGIRNGTVNAHLKHQSFSVKRKTWIGNRSASVDAIDPKTGQCAFESAAAQAFLDVTTNIDTNDDMSYVRSAQWKVAIFERMCRFDSLMCCDILSDLLPILKGEWEYDAARRLGWYYSVHVSAEDQLCALIKQWADRYLDKPFDGRVRKDDTQNVENDDEKDGADDHG